MPHISVEQVQDIRLRLKKRFPEVKFSVVKAHHSSVIVAIMESEYSWSKNYMDINYFYPENYENSKFLTEVINIMNVGNDDKYYDPDYGMIPSFYIELTVGKFGKPHKFKRGH